MIIIQQEGGLGNQLFMQAFGFAYAKKHNLEYYVYTKVNHPHIYDKELRNLDCYKFPGIKYCDTLPDLPIYNEPHFRYAEIPKMDNVIFAGFWQSWRYFDHYRDDVLKAFRFDDIPTNDDSVALHIRRTDYLLYPEYHPPITLDYIKKAVSKFEGDYYFQIFSDDIQWAKENLNEEIFGEHDYQFEETRGALIDLHYMAMAEHQITSNSTYSWWASYINPNPRKTIINPSKWFGPALNHDTSDLYLPKSIII